MKVESGIDKKNTINFLSVRLWPKFKNCTLRQMATTWDSSGKGLKRKSPEIVLVFEIQPWIPTAAPMTELVDSHSRSDDT